MRMCKLPEQRRGCWHTQTGSQWPPVAAPRAAVALFQHAAQLHLGQWMGQPPVAQRKAPSSPARQVGKCVMMLMCRLPGPQIKERQT